MRIAQLLQRPPTSTTPSRLAKEPFVRIMGSLLHHPAEPLGTFILDSSFKATERQRSQRSFKRLRIA
jgi:hypothetical protein